MSDLLNFDRRSMLERMAFLLGAAALPSAALAAKPAARAKRFLDAGRTRLLSAVADTIIPKTDTPGALDAKVPAKFDALLVGWASPQRRIELVGALAKIDDAAKAQEKKGFAALSPEKRKAVLGPYDAAALKPVPDTRGLKGMMAMMAGPTVADPGYAKLRELIILLYFYSEEALTSELTYEHAPGGWTPSIKVTPETRNSGGMGMF
jgi:gluconate 2-dehydrogenase gamma chain